MSNKNGKAVSVENLRREFGAFVAVNDISFEVDRGEIFGFLGPNGAGKSTTIRMLCGLLRPTSGSGQVAGFDIMRESEKIKTRIGYMSQKFSLYQTLTVEENLNFYAGVYLIAPDEHKRKKQLYFQNTILGSIRDRVVEDLPSGTKQLLALFCAIQHDPEIIFLDEPTAGVDPISRRYFWEQIDQQAESGVTVFVTTHYLDEAEECDRIGMIFSGTLTAIGDPRDLKRDRFSGRVFRVATDTPWETAELIKGIEGVRDVAPFGSELHITVLRKDADAILGQINAKLSGGLVAKAVDPNLEDLFIALIEESES